MSVELSDLLKPIFPPENSEDLIVEVTDKVLNKNQVRRFRVSMFILDQLLREGRSLIGEDVEKQILNWEICVKSVFELWEAAACLWQNGKFSTATALAITTVEETGKLSVDRMRMLGIESLPFTDDERLELSKEWILRKRPFLDHLTKSAVASMSGALVNSRLDRIVGLDFVTEFLDLAEAGALEQLRQECLYLDRNADFLMIPQNRISREESAKFIALAGEVLVEILPHPKEWKVRLEEIKEYERMAGLTEE